MERLAHAEPDTAPVASAAALDAPLVVTYIGNLEPYQGIDLLLESVRLALPRTSSLRLVIIGGTARDVARYQARCGQLGILEHVRFLGPRPLRELGEHLEAADVVVSPRLQGHNTPMKIYSYLHSGKALVATDLPTHTQVLDARVAMLSAPTPPAFADALVQVLEDADLRRRLGQAGRRLVEERFTYRAFRDRLNGLMDWLQTEAGPR
jgi:glycosyltransferase involved in cell wall biosynthesis